MLQSHIRGKIIYVFIKVKRHFNHSLEKKDVADYHVISG